MARYIFSEQYCGYEGLATLVFEVDSVSKEQIDKIKNNFVCLTKREAGVLKKLFALDEIDSNSSRQEIADKLYNSSTGELGVSLSRVDFIKKNAMKKLLNGLPLTKKRAPIRKSKILYENRHKFNSW